MRKLYCIFMCLFPYIMLFLFAGLPNMIDVPDVLYEIVIGAVFFITFIMALIIGHGNGAFLPKRICFWSIVIKLAHLPFFGFLGILIGLAGVISIIPVPFMIFVGLSLATGIVFVIGYFMFHSGIIGMSAVLNAKKVGAVSGIWVLVFIVLQFIPGADLAALAYLYFKTRNCE